MAHRYGIERMLQVGVVPITVESLVSEWMHDWGNPKAMELVREVYSHYGYMIGLQLRDFRSIRIFYRVVSGAGRNHYFGIGSSVCYDPGHHFSPECRSPGSNHLIRQQRSNILTENGKNF